MWATISAPAAVTWPSLPKTVTISTISTSTTGPCPIGIIWLWEPAIDKANDTGAFNKGDLIFVKKVDPATLKVGDVITYISNDKEKSIITHRIVSIYEDGSFETKGDYSPGYDRDPVKYDQVVGIYTGRIARAGDLALFFQTPVGVIVLLGIPLVAILALDFFQKRKENDKVSSEKAELEAELAKLRAEKEALAKEANE